MIHVNIESAKDFVGSELLEKNMENACAGLDTVLEGTGAGNEFLGWVDLPEEIGEGFVSDCREVARRWSGTVDAVVVTGIGGSYLGARSAIEALSHSFSASLPGPAPRVVFAGQNISEDYLAELMDYLQMRTYAVVVISKSGTTTEPAIAFRVLREDLEKRFGKEVARERIVAVTDARKGALRTLADREGYTTFVIPDNVGGRYSVLTAVGLLPIALAGFDIRELAEGARAMRQACRIRSAENPAVRYAAMRNALYRSGKKIEILVNYNPKLLSMGEWWKQLFGESEGKDGKGIFPAAAGFSTDLHSLGQYIQDGERTLFETNLLVKTPERTVELGLDRDNLDGLNYLAGKRLEEVNRMAQLGTRLAHTDGGVPNILIELDRLDAYHVGGLFYLFEMACGISGYMLGVNPFDQPGVEQYKRNMFALLEKPGYEEQTRALRARIS